MIPPVTESLRVSAIRSGSDFAHNFSPGDGEVPGPGNRLPVARELGETSLMLLVHPTLTEQNIEDTIRVAKDVICRTTK
jgi:dTDP-4-amino-4,6-dideoxygalactose transaminase